MRAHSGMDRRHGDNSSALPRKATGPVLLDDPPFSGYTFAQAAKILRRSGFAVDRIAAVFPDPGDSAVLDAGQSSVSPVASASRSCDHHHRTGRLAHHAIAGTSRRRLVLDRVLSGQRLSAHRGRRSQPSSGRACIEGWKVRRKKHGGPGQRVYEVHLEASDGSRGTRLVMALKGVGFGYLSYHAFLAGSQLKSEFVPPLLGFLATACSLRNGSNQTRSR